MPTRQRTKLDRQMNTGLIAKRYATALELYSSECGQERQCYENALAMLSVLPAVEEYMRSPRAAADKRRILAEALVASCPAFERFLDVVVAHKRESRLRFILQSFISAYKKVHNIVGVQLTVAAAPSAALLEKLEETIKKSTGAESVEFTVKTDPSIIGGFICKVDDRRLDASVLRQINDLKKVFETNQKRII